MAETYRAGPRAVDGAPTRDTMAQVLGIGIDQLRILISQGQIASAPAGEVWRGSMPSDMEKTCNQY
jgi:hypothetical protein